jgi:hypothetical protein
VGRQLGGAAEAPPQLRPVVGQPQPIYSESTTEL